ncbi:MAG: acyltransferase [Rhodoplanes sp.]|uniref:acyltransferase family protein n=1 Tax=Rhodoplanes sp. TaxID=1968906 RepID=UPI0017AC96E0|nr:acyltransferase [Rhodoplanes sp.]NVO13968.1 acyltransferase [Rhodoplanes sp.]
MQRNHSLDGLRGFAAAAVVVFHAILLTDHGLVHRVLGPPFQHVPVAELPVKLALSLANGETAVAIFFVLSGAVLFDSLQRMPGAAEFVVRRVLRIYPALVAAILTGAAVMALQHAPPSFDSLAANLGLAEFSIIGPAWTLQAELVAVPFILASFWVARMVGPAGLAIAFAAAYFAVRAPGIQDVAVWLRPYVICFTLGFAITTPAGAAIGRRLSGGWCVVALAVILVLRHASPSVNLGTYMLQGGAALLVCALWHGRGGWLGDALSRPGPRFLGRISYSLYLFNIPILMALSPIITVGDPLLVGLPAGLAIVALTVPVAALSERWIERPGIKAGHAMAKWLATARPTRRARWLSRAPAELRSPS